MLHTEITPPHPDCIESWPYDGPLAGVSACGLYCFDEMRKKRRGGIVFAKTVSAGAGKAALSAAKFFPTSDGIADLHWMPQELEACALLAAITSNCAMAIFRVADTTWGEGEIELKCEKVHEAAVLAVPLDYIGLSTELQPGLSPEKAVASTSDGTVAVLDIGSKEPRIAHSWTAHEGSEVWTTTINESGNVIATGADDCAMKLWDIRADDHVGPVQNTRAHTAGVTSVKFLDDGTRLLSGSYDEIIRYWDTRSLRSPISTVKAAGGVWRMKTDQRDNSRLLVAACQGGSEVWDIGVDFSAPRRVASLPGTERSYHYGVSSFDVDRLPLAGNREGEEEGTGLTPFAVASGGSVRLSCSFFENVIVAW
eukprot:Polyplicarium_translucidae@DN1836_c0_g1_i1.p1